MKKLSSKIQALILASLVALIPAAAFAGAITVTTSAGANVSTKGLSAGAGLQVATGAHAKDLGDKEIDRRTVNLNQLLARTSAMARLSADEKASLSSALSAQITVLATLKAKVDADTDLTSLKTDVQSITKSYRIYMLILPQARIAASADRVETIAGEMQSLGAKLKVRIDADTTSDTSALQRVYADMQAKIADANTQAGAAVSATANLSPDNGDASIAASNTAALRTGRADITAATADLKAARADIQTIITGLGVRASATASTTTP